MPYRVSAPRPLYIITCCLLSIFKQLLIPTGYEASESMNEVLALLSRPSHSPTMTHKGESLVCQQRDPCRVCTVRLWIRTVHLYLYLYVFTCIYIYIHIHIYIYMYTVRLWICTVRLRRARGKRSSVSTATPVGGQYISINGVFSPGHVLNPNRNRLG
jgi:hypothetical protein